MQKRRKDRDGVFERPDSPYLWGQYKDSSGRWVRRSTGIPKGKGRIDEARRIVSQWREASEHERRTGRPLAITFHNLIQQFSAAHPNRETERDDYSLKHLYPFFNPRPLNNATRQDARDYITFRQSQGASAGTINREIGFFSAALTWAKREGWPVDNIMIGMRQQEPSGRDRWLTRDEADRLLNAARRPRAPYLHDYVLLILQTGLRPGEALSLEWDRVDLGQRLIHFNPSDQKNRQRDSVPLNDDAVGALLSRWNWIQQRCPASPWVFCNAEGDRIGTVKKAFAAAVKDAGIKGCHPHDLRRTAGSWMIQAGVGIEAVSKILRHADIRVTAQVYAHLSKDNLRAAADALIMPTKAQEHSKVGR